jgi:hypothetical protein
LIVMDHDEKGRQSDREPGPSLEQERHKEDMNDLEWHDAATDGNASTTPSSGLEEGQPSFEEDKPRQEDQGHVHPHAKGGGEAHERTVSDWATATADEEPVEHQGVEGQGKAIGEGGEVESEVNEEDEDRQAESMKQREILAGAVGGILLVMLKAARKAKAEEFSTLTQLITESNGALVVLKYLNQDVSKDPNQSNGQANGQQGNGEGQGDGNGDSPANGSNGPLGTSGSQTAGNGGETASLQPLFVPPLPVLPWLRCNINWVGSWAGVSLRCMHD